MPSPALRGGVALMAATSALAIAALPAHAATASFPSNSSVDAAAGAWTGSSSCALLCATDASWKATGGAGGGGRLSMTYSTLANVLGTAAGQAAWTSGQFTWTGGDVTDAKIRLDRKADVATLLNLGGSVRLRAVLVDVTAGTETTVVDQSLTSADNAYNAVSADLATDKLVAGHDYRVRVRTDFSAAVQVAGGAEVSVDNVRLEVLQPDTPTLPASPPSVLAGETTAKVTTSLNPGDLDATYYVEYGVGTFGQTTTQVVLGHGAGDTPISIDLTGLIAATDYRARLVVKSGGKTYYGTVVEFRTANASGGGPAPTAPAFPVDPPIVTPAQTGFTIDGDVTVGGEDGVWYVEYGLGDTFTSKTSDHNVLSTAGHISLHELVSGLLSNRRYRARFVFKTARYTVYGDTVIFDTTPAPGDTTPPVIATEGPNVEVTETGAWLSSAVVPGSETSSYYLQWGAEGGFTTQSPTQTLNPGSSPVSVDVWLANLTADTAYQARFVYVTNGVVRYGTTVHFRTASGGVIGTSNPTDDTGGTTGAGGEQLVDTTFTPTVVDVTPRVIAVPTTITTPTVVAKPRTKVVTVRRAGASIKLVRRNLTTTVTGVRAIKSITIALPKSLSRRAGATVTVGSKRYRVKLKGTRRVVRISSVPAGTTKVAVRITVRKALKTKARRQAVRKVTVRLGYTDGSSSKLLRTAR